METGNAAEEAGPERGVARRVVVSFRDDDWVADELDADSYRGYLRRAHEGAVAVGDEWSEFVDCGCGPSRDVTLRVERVEGGDRVGPDTEFAFRPR